MGNVFFLRFMISVFGRKKRNLFLRYCFPIFLYVDPSYTRKIENIMVSFSFYRNIVFFVMWYERFNQKCCEFSSLMTDGHGFVVMFFPPFRELFVREIDSYEPVFPAFSEKMIRFYDISVVFFPKRCVAKLFHIFPVFDKNSKIGNPSIFREKIFCIMFANCCLCHSFSDIVIKLPTFTIKESCKIDSFIFLILGKLL